MRSIFPKQFVLIVLGFSAIAHLSCQGQLPDRWSKEMELIIYNGDGRAPVSKTVVIKNSSCRFTEWVESKKHSHIFTLTQKELDRMLKEMNAADFINMTSADSKSIAYDKATTSIQFKWPDHIHKVSDGAVERVSGDKSNVFYKLYSYIDSLVMVKIKKLN